MGIRKTFRFRAKTARNMCHNVFAIPIPGDGSIWKDAQVIAVFRFTYTFTVLFGKFAVFLLHFSPDRV